MLQRYTRLLHRPHGVQRAQCRALVVSGAPAVQFAVLDLAAQRVVLPAVAQGHHVQVGQHAHGPGAAAEGDIPGIAIDVPHLKAEAPPVFKGGVQHPADLPAKGRVFAGRLPLHRGYGDPFAYVFDQLVPVGIDEAVEVGVVHGDDLREAFDFDSGLTSGRDWIIMNTESEPRTRLLLRDFFTWFLIQNRIQSSPGGVAAVLFAILHDYGDGKPSDVECNSHTLTSFRRQVCNRHARLLSALGPRGDSDIL